MHSRPGTAPTIETIARHAGVSTASVSRVLRGLGGRPDTVARVRAAATELGYVPNAMARSLRGGQSRQVTFAMPDIGNPVYIAMVRRIQQVVRAAGYRLLLHSTGADPAEELAALRALADRHSDGLILCPIRVTPAHLEELARSAAPVVVIGSVPEEVPVDSVRADSVTGAELAVRHLVAAGRRRIGLLNGPADTVPGAARHRGYERGLEVCGLPHDPALTSFGRFDAVSGEAAARDLLARVPGVDALFCANDLIAVGALRALRGTGRDVPADVAVVGVDNTDLAEACWPPLTSVDLGSQERGRLAAELLIARLDASGRPPVSRLAVQPRLVVRGSCGSTAGTTATHKEMS
ncbi:LacI family DNA-binding transcriptional regulator [Streptomyces sp. SL13]|uniref:LacI family DNA-binding transcriptional regulator n=1 Tax=Streptantibioticus silvisoli TaxID=2705255 RepID=A0AA90H8A5_9ACTN|nr:LacI family DNA-binding transcriptional regulator [Streptantibioticus silvisoli]MDI5961715.1 LacI family DNA-binding transcriptional regulator [Streptantibioticus silvisoli]MDI5972332.1 LacI family DNA-binding transcriptional regulator [Streptantibioticus silvisoli]